MNNKKATKRALLTSVMALAMCVVMLVGTTFAWFTDTAKTSVNKIQAGKLDVALEMKQGDEWVNAEGATLDFVKAEGEEVLWEPGCRYELPKLRVVNNGNLALKYKIQVTGIDGDAKLNEVIDWDITGTDVTADGYAHLKANESKEITIKGVMQTTAGNEYQGLSIDGIAITVVATQDTVEHDSIDDQYDKDAPIYNVTPETAQATLDTIDGYATIKLGKGDYGMLYLRPVKGNANTGLKDSIKYYRTITGLTIEGSEGATVKGIKTGADGSQSIDYFTEINNLTIKGVSFTSDGTTNGFEASATLCSLDGLVMDGCIMKAGDGFNTNGGDEGNLYKSKAAVSNITIKNCEVDGIQRLVTFDKVTNVTITGNTINNVAGHGIHFGSAQANAMDGVLVIANNTADGLTCRFLRMDKVAPTATVTISGNKLTNYNNLSDMDANKHSSVDAMKLTNVAEGATVTIKDNTVSKGGSYGDRITRIGVNDDDYFFDGSKIDWSTIH